MLYREERVEEMVESHSKFIRNLPEEVKLNLKECISRMALGLSPPVLSFGMDCELFVIIGDRKAGDRTITALNPVARRALILYHGRGLTTSLGSAAKKALKRMDYTDAIKAKISELYTTTMSEISLLF